MPILALLELSVQIFFAVHAFRTGRDRYWLYIILIPGIGSVIYFFAEYLPDMQANMRIKNMRSGHNYSFLTSISPAKRLKFLQTQVEMTPSLNNKKDLAREYVNTCMFDQAISTYNSCLEGIHEDDPTILEGLACAHYFKGDFHKALTMLEKLTQVRGQTRGDKFDLLYAQALEQMGKNDQALEQYEKIFNLFSGEEAKCRYAMLLLKTGNPAKAKEVFEQVLKFSEIQPRFYLKEQREWIALAKQHVQTL